MYTEFYVPEQAIAHRHSRNNYFINILLLTESPTEKYFGK